MRVKRRWNKNWIEWIYRTPYWCFCHKKMKC